MSNKTDYKAVNIGIRALDRLPEVFTSYQFNKAYQEEAGSKDRPNNYQICKVRNQLQEIEMIEWHRAYKSKTWYKTPEKLERKTLFDTRVNQPEALKPWKPKPMVEPTAEQMESAPDAAVAGFIEACKKAGIAEITIKFPY